MNKEDVVTGSHDVGPFNLWIAVPVYNTEPEDELTHLEVLVTEKDEFYSYYVNLVKDQRFGHLKSIRNFSRTFTEKDTTEDLIEVNHYVSSVFHELQTPMFRLSRASIVKLFDDCERMSNGV